MIGSIFLAAALQQQASPLPAAFSAAAGKSAAEPVTHRVAPGETLSSIAPLMGESWQQLYVNNRSVVGGNPNLIYVGEMLHAGPVTPAVAAYTSHLALAGAPSSAPAVPPAPHYQCGDGDGDGYDIPCSQLHSQAPAPAPAPVVQDASVQAPAQASGSGTYSYAALEALWESAGGPSWAAASAATIAECESGGRPTAYNPSGATGIWQILGAVVGGNLDNPYDNALNAVAKFKASGDTFAQWVCQA